MALGWAVAVAVPAGLGWDFANFYDAGRRAAAGQIAELYQPDSPIRGQPPQGKLAFWSAPLSAWLYVPLAALEPETALITFKLQNVLAYAAAFFLLYLLHSPFAGPGVVGRWRFTALFAFLCLIYQPFWAVFRLGGQTTPTVLLLLVLALAAHMGGRVALSSLLVVIAVLIKPALITLLALLILLAGWRFLGWTALYGGIAAVLSLATAPWALHLAFMSKMLSGAGRTFPWPWNSSLAILVGPLPAGWPQVTASLLLKAMVFVTFLHLIVRSRAHTWPPPARRHFHLLLAVLFFLLISATVWEHYLALLFLFLSYVVAQARAFPRPALFLVVAIFLLALGQNLIVVDALRHRFDFTSPIATAVVSLVKSGPLLLTLIFLWHHGRRWLDSYHMEPWQTANPWPSAVR